ncbi:hypothetical protein O6H91_07G003000 [Diphasiastrum complanatum]|uniref:Uncharacterized protein n=1 Tax=Diphasiastrum complanatum TaxID=34168 RepID=A0ACC2D246_DIPCM|nr:hypothetical protein O6H91_07G003000 [Diphasiastrum complanatum]
MASDALQGGSRNEVDLNTNARMSSRRTTLAVLNTNKRMNFPQVILEGAIAGGTAGVVVETVLYPIDTIKTRLQATRFGGKIDFRGLYSGLGGNLVGVLPASALFVAVYEPLKQKLLELVPDHLSSIAHLTAGAAGGAVASLVRVPTEVIKQRLQTGQFSSATKAVQQIVVKEGVTGLYAGYGSFLLRDLPFDAIQFCIYEQLRIVYKKVAKRELGGPETALVGAVAGAITGAVTTPLDVIKTRLMVQGVAPRVLWIGIGGSIFFAVLERTKQLLAELSLKNSMEVSSRSNGKDL